MITSISMHVGSSTEEREAFDSLKVAANATNTKYYIGTDFTTVYDLLPGETVDVSFDTYVEIDGAEPLIIYQGKKYPRGFREGLQSALTPAQLAAVNSGITAAKVSQYDGYAAQMVNALDTFLTKNDAVSTYEPKLTGAKRNAVTSTITKDKVISYEKIKTAVNGCLQGSFSLDIDSTKILSIIPNEDTGEIESITLQDVTNYRISYNLGEWMCLVSKPFIFDGHNIPMAISTEGRVSGWRYYLAINDNGWMFVDFSAVNDYFDDNTFLYHAMYSDVYLQLEIIGRDGYDYMHEGEEMRVIMIPEDQRNLLDVANNPYVLDPGESSPESVTVEYTSNNIIKALEFYEKDKAIPHYGNHFFMGKVWKGEPNSPDAREVDMYYAQRSAIPTYKAKKVGDNYVCVPIADADNTYDLYVAVLDYDHIGHSYISLTAPNGAFIAEQTDNFTNDGSITVLGNPVFNPTYTGNRKKLIVSPTDSCVWYEANETIADVLKREIDYRELLSAEVAALTSANSLCTWKKYDAITGDNAYPNFTSLVSGNTTAWQIDDDTLVGNIEIDATKGNRIFDFRNLKDANDEPIPVNFVVNIAGFTSYETIIFFKGIDVYSISPTSPLAMSSLCFCGEEPDLDTEKEYVLSIQGNTLIFGELNRGVDAETEEE